MCKKPIYRLGSVFRTSQPGEISLLETYIAAVGSQELLLMYQPPQLPFRHSVPLPRDCHETQLLVMDDSDARPRSTM